MDFDRLRFAETTSKLDSDLRATEVGSTKDKKNSRGETETSSTGAICRFFQKTAGCRRTKCMYTHKCIICNKLSHGAVNCYARTKLKEENNPSERATRSEVRSNQATRSEDRPPDPRTRRARAILP